MKKFDEQTILSLIIRIIGGILCSILIRHHISLPNNEEFCDCIFSFLIFLVCYLIAYILERHKNNQTNFFSELISIGLSLLLGLYFIYLSHPLCGTFIILAGIFFITIQHMEAMDAVDKGTVDRG